MDGVERILNDLIVIIYGIEDKSSSSNLFVYKIYNASCHLISLRVCFLYMENGIMMLSTSGVRWQSHKAIYRQVLHKLCILAHMLILVSVKGNKKAEGYEFKGPLGSSVS